MTRPLNAGRAGAPKGEARSIVVLLHGYGADGADLLGLGDQLAPHLPGTAFFAPDAPEACRGNPMGRQWFPIPWLDGSSIASAEAGIVAASDDLNAWLDTILAAEGVAPARVILAGFSQGAMMALHVGVRRAAPVAGIVAISGRLLVPERLAAEAISKPPVMLIHGDRDPTVPFVSMKEAGDALVGAGFRTYGHVMEGTGHGIAPDGLSAALAFIASELGT